MRPVIPSRLSIGRRTSVTGPNRCQLRAWSGVNAISTGIFVTSICSGSDDRRRSWQASP